MRDSCELIPVDDFGEYEENIKESKRFTRSIKFI